MQFAQLRQRLLDLDTACVCDADSTLRVLDPTIRPLRPDVKLVGHAYTVSCRDDFLTVLGALREARPSDVLVVDGRGGHRALAGELIATEAVHRGLAGIVVDGAIRDTRSVSTLAIAVYSRSVNPTAGTAVKLSNVQVPITCGGVEVRPGDVVYGDGDGVVVASEGELARLLPTAETIRQTERRALEEMARGRSLFDLLNVSEHLSAVREGRPSALAFNQ